MRLLIPFALAATALMLNSVASAAEPPAVGQAAPDFQLHTVDGQSVKLSAATSKGPVVLVVLRGYPGYQCPICTRQFGSLLKATDKLAAAGAIVLLVYPGPGPAEKLNAYAREFLKDAQLPSHFRFVTDPGYSFTNLWGLRWDAEKETAYPSTFVIGRDMKVVWSKVSKTHGGRASVEEILSALERTKK